MEELGKIHQLIIPFGEYQMTFNLEVILMTWIVIACLIFFGIMTTRKRGIRPSALQSVGELFVSQLF